jgi:hypothetical protein
MEELKFNSTYYFADLVESHIYGEAHFCNYSEEIFIDRALNFRKETLLHHYIETTIWNYYNRDIRKYGGDYTYYIFFFKRLFKIYDIDSKLFDKLGDDEDSSNEKILEKYNETFEKKWHRNESAFRQLLNKIARDVFYIYFGNRDLLLHFNQIVSDIILDHDFPTDKLNIKGKIKRKNIPQWVKKAVFSRDKGRCTLCTKDLTGLIAVDQRQHYDHIVPLNLGGVNDPTNIQLLCETCNLEKSGNDIETSKLYLTWWK